MEKRPQLNRTKNVDNNIFNSVSYFIILAYKHRSISLRECTCVLQLVSEEKSSNQQIKRIIYYLLLSQATATVSFIKLALRRTVRR